MMNNTLSHQGLKDQKENIKEKAMARKVNIAKFEKKKIYRTNIVHVQKYVTICVFLKKKFIKNIIMIIKAAKPSSIT